MEKARKARASLAEAEVKGIGERLRTLRKAAGATQAGYAERLGITLKAYQAMEAASTGATPSLPPLVAAVRDSGCSADWLLFGADAPKGWADGLSDIEQQVVSGLIEAIRKAEPAKRRELVAEVYRIVPPAE